MAVAAVHTCCSFVAEAAAAAEHTQNHLAAVVAGSLSAACKSTAVVAAMADTVAAVADRIAVLAAVADRIAAVADKSAEAESNSLPAVASAAEVAEEKAQTAGYRKVILLAHSLHSVRLEASVVPGE